VIIDTDCGTDDAFAIMQVLAEPSVEVVAITCVAGNCSIENVVHNVGVVLDIMKKSHIPYYKGGGKPLLGPLRLPKWTGHGSDGLGNHSKSADYIPPSTSPQSLHAVNALLHYVNESPGVIHLITLGPLTNVALAVSMDETWAGKVASVTAMMGSYAGQGNVNGTSEFNVQADPEAAAIVMETKWKEFLMVTWCLTNEHGIPWKWYKENLANSNTYLGKMFRQITEGYYLAYAPKEIVDEERDVRNLNFFIQCDMYATTCFLYPESIKKKKELWCVVELQGKFGRGVTFFDHHKYTGNEPNCTLIMKIDQKVVETSLENLLKWVPQNE